MPDELHGRRGRVAPAAARVQSRLAAKRLRAARAWGSGPIIATQLLHVVPSWRWVFWIVAIPGFIVGALLFAVLREPAQTQGGALIGATQASGRWLEVLKSRNIVLGMLALFCAMSCVFVLSALVPTYLVSYLKLSAGPDGDRHVRARLRRLLRAVRRAGAFGRVRPQGPSRSSASSARPRRSGCSRTPARIPPVLFVGLFVVSFFCLGNVALITGPIATEAAPAGLISSAIGVVVGAGEIFGGGIAPSIAGFVGESLRHREHALRRVDGRHARRGREPVVQGDGAAQDGARREPGLISEAPRARSLRWRPDSYTLRRLLREAVP